MPAMGGVLFGQTMWTQIQAAKGQDAAALESIVRQYRPAVG